MKRALLLLTLALPLAAQVDVTVVNVIPHSLSNETERDAEPSIAVDPADPRRVALTAFTPDPLMSGNAPIFVSTNGGASWELRPFVPGGNVTWDVSLRFAGLSGILYGSGIPEGASSTHVLRKPDFPSATLPTILRSGSRDQPWVEATTVLGGAAPDRVYITAGDGGVEQSLDAATAPPPGGHTFLDLNPAAGCTQRNAPSVRSAIHGSGRVYVAYLRWNDCSADPRIGDVIVVRDDEWGASAAPYRALMTGSSIGAAAATAQPFPFFDGLGGQRVGSQIAIAVDPTHRDVVYVAWGAGPSGPEQTLYLRRSGDGGATWSRDLRVVPNATNPALAVNSQGVLGFMYQRYIPATNRWETHFEASGTDVLLADVPNTTPSGNQLGDYANMIAVGKHFYGAFSASNEANRANFPRGVTYLRNVNWTAGRLRNLTNTADVAPSIDPFFFRVRMLPPHRDFYVRDWNDGATGDDGAEPSTHPVFYQTGDVWNRRGTDPGTPGPNDPPPAEDAGNGAGSAGDNWAFARIRRNAPAPSGSTTVTAHFLVSEFGTGSAYSDSTTANPNLTFGPDVTVTFEAGDTGPLTTPPMRWHLDPVLSPHLCLAVEISAPDDAYVPPSLAGQWPGWGTGTDLRVLADNNRAQRNLGLTTIPARETGVMDEHFAVIHNGATFTRDMELTYDVIGAVKPVFRVDGEVVHGPLVLKDMKPGENRSLAVELHVQGPAEIRFAERFAGAPVNGFTIAARVGPLEEVIREKLALHFSVFTRLAAGGVAGAAAEAAVVRQAKPDPKSYVALLQKRIGRMARLLPDGFAIQPALNELGASLKLGDPAAVAAAHSVLLHRAGAALTRARLDAGDPADIVQMVRWQRDLFRGRKLPCAAKLVAASERYLGLIGRRRITNAEYPSLLKESAACLADAGATKEQVSALFDAASLAGQQKAHRALLLVLAERSARAGLHPGRW